MPETTNEQRAEQSIEMTGMEVFIPCANGGKGEVAVFEGRLHWTTKFTINANNVSGVTHVNPQGSAAVGSVTGDKYQGAGASNLQFTAKLDDTTDKTFTIVNSFQVIGQGPGNNVTVHQVCRVTRNAAGQVTASVGNLTAECR